MALLLMAATACGGEGGEGTPTEPEINVVRGTVVVAGTQVLLSGVQVMLDDRSVQSDDRGQYRFEDVPVGAATLSANPDGYLPYERSVQIQAGVNDFDIPLLPDG